MIGLGDKYYVHRVDMRDAPGEKHYRCAYFVLDLTHDPFARWAAREYANIIADSNQELASDILALLNTIARNKDDAAS